MKKIDLSIGSGGKSMKDFIEKFILKYLDSKELSELSDSAHLSVRGRIGFTTDGFVINPVFFPGGDIGKLAVAGTVNDLVVSGAKPLYLSLSLIIEEGFSLEDMERILLSIKETSEVAKVKVVTGDTKVVRKGEADGIYITTAGVGEVVRRKVSKVKEGDCILITGSPGDHGVAVMIAREEFEFEGDCVSDCEPMVYLLDLWNFEGVKWMRDITRGGLATVLSEFASQMGVTVFIREEDVPFSPPVSAVSEILGIDPFYLPSEGKAVIVVSGDEAERVLTYLRKKAGCINAEVIGEVKRRERDVDVVLKTISGGYRILEPLTGELLPRIC